jgi:hypothetical protein
LGVCFLSHLTRTKQFLLVPPAVSRIEYRNAGKEQRAGRIPPFDCVDEYGNHLTIPTNQIERDLVEGALHPQQGREMRLVVDAPGNIQKVLESLARDVTRRIAKPTQERGIGAVYSAIRIYG